jgi:hypothetical protein
MLRVMIIDRSNPIFAIWIRKLADHVNDLDLRLVFVSDKERSEVKDNLEVINVHDVPRLHDIEYFQRKFPFSIHKLLVPERSFFDYSSFRKCQRYSDLDQEEIASTVIPYLNAFDFVVREKADFVLEGLADNFMTALAVRIAGYYGKGSAMIFAYYWWRDGVLVVDRPDQTSSEIDARYEYYMVNPGCIDRNKMDQLFSEKRATFQFKGGGVYPLRLRLKQLAARSRSYEPISWKNWICRKISTISSRVMIRTFIRQDRGKSGEQYVVFPLHVSPEATLLGSVPELADQFWLIKNISMNLPFGVKLYVKDHPSQPVGQGLDFGFYRRLRSLPNVRLIRADANLALMLDDRQCLAVAVINGTVGLDAARKKKPVFVFGKAIYGHADCFLKPKNFDEFHQQLRAIQEDRFTFNETALYAMLHALDDNVVRADVDFSSYSSWADMVLGTLPIYKAYFQKLLGKHQS